MRSGFKAGTCPRIPPRMAQTGGNSLVSDTNLSRRASGTWDSLNDCD